MRVSTTSSAHTNVRIECDARILTVVSVLRYGVHCSGMQDDAIQTIELIVVDDLKVTE
jgi:hypothetical protein